jgi:hypothetical protein
MHKLIISLICFLIPVAAQAAAPEIRDNAPDRHVVVKGDTLWDISATFFKDPWKWPEIWGLNKDTIKDPHWIYPGQVVYLDRAAHVLRIGEGAPEAGAASGVPANPVVKLSPKVRRSPSEHGAIPSIPLEDIAPFLSQPLVIENEDLANAPQIAGSAEQRTLLGNGDVAYVKGLPAGTGPVWQVFRAGKTFVDPDTQEDLGHEAVYLGDAVVEKSAKVSTLRIEKEKQEIMVGNLLVQPRNELMVNYLPHAPDAQVNARVISIYGGVSQGGQNTIITLSKGRRDGIENGHVLALFRKGEALDKDTTLPDTRYGLVFVFRTFEKVSYALVMQSSLPVELLDRAGTP